MESTTMREAFEEIERLSRNPETRRLADFREQELMDIMQREEDAREDAREETKKEVAISMYTGGMSEEDIAKFVKLSIEDVRAITRTIEQ